MKLVMRFGLVGLPILLAALIVGCSTSGSRYSQHHDSAPRRNVNVDHIPNAVPRVEPRSKYGNSPSYVVRGKRYYVMDSAHNYKARGIASWYGTKFHGHRTSNGESYNMYAMSAAHKSLPLPSYVEVTNLRNGRKVIVRVNDRGPFHRNRLIDLSYAAAKKLGITAEGTGWVEIRAIDPRQHKRRHSRPYALQKTTPAVTPQVTPKVAVTSTPTTTDYRMYLQVGAFISRNNAEQLQQRLGKVLSQTTIQTGYNAEKKMYRVRIGPLASVEEADQLAEKITRNGIASPQIVID